MIKENVKELMLLNVGFNIKHEKLMLRSLDDGRFTVTFNIEIPSESWEKEFEAQELENAIAFFISNITTLNKLT